MRFLEGIEPWSDDYISWARTSTVKSAELIFRHGVQNLLMVALVPIKLKEVNRYQEQLFAKAQWVMAGTESLTDYPRLDSARTPAGGRPELQRVQNNRATSPRRYTCAECPYLLLECCDR